MREEINEIMNKGHLAELNAMLPYAEFVGFEIQEDDDMLTTILKAREDNIGNALIGAIHGGVIGGLMEHAASFELLFQLEELDRIPRIVNVTVDYLRPSFLKDTYARAEIIKKGKRVANLRVTAWQDNPEKPVAVAHTHFLIA